MLSEEAQETIRRLESDLHRLKQDHDALDNDQTQLRKRVSSVETASDLLKQEIKAIPQKVDETFKSLWKSFIGYPIVTVLTFLIFLVAGLLGSDFFAIATGKSLVALTRLDSTLAGTIEYHDRKTNPHARPMSDLEVAILRLVQLDLDNDLKEADIIDLSEIFKRLRDAENSDIFETETLASAVNKMNNKLEIFNNRPSVGFSFSGGIAFAQDTESVREFVFPARREKNPVHVSCAFDFVTNGRPKRIEFWFDHAEEAIRYQKLTVGEKLQSANFTILPRELPDQNENFHYKLRMKIPPKIRHLTESTPSVALSSSGSSGTASSPDLYYSCFVLIIGEPPQGGEG